MTSIEASARATGTIERALNVLREATASKDKTQTRGVALALWVLRGRCPDDWLAAFWDAAGSDHEIGRSQGLHAAYNGIVRQVRASGGLGCESNDARR
jgi:hypothetical protein